MHLTAWGRSMANTCGRDLPRADLWKSRDVSHGPSGCCSSFWSSCIPKLSPPQGRQGPGGMQAAVGDAPAWKCLVQGVMPGPSTGLLVPCSTASVLVPSAHVSAGKGECLWVAAASDILCIPEKLP